MYFIYIILCKDKSLYTGITTDVQRRFWEHKNGKGGRYTRAKGAEKILYSKKCGSRSKAQRREAEIKSWSRADKLMLIKKARTRGIF